MPPFKEDQILVIAPGSQTTLAQLGIPESLTPAAHHIRSCMFAAEKEGEYEPRKIRRKAPKAPVANGDAQHASATEPTSNAQPVKSMDDLYEYEEDPLSETDAIWPIVHGQIVDWPCFYALMTHVFTTINPPFHTPVLLIAEPVWTPRDHEKLTQFFFEKFKIPAFVIMDAAMATSYAYRLPHATVVDVGYEKADITAINDHLVHLTGRTLALADCGGSAMTDALLQRLSGSKFSRDMCEQLKKSPICEILPPEDASAAKAKENNPAAAASTGANGPVGATAAALDASEGGDPALAEDNEGVLDIASIVTSGNMTEFLEQKEREKQEKAAAKAQRKAGETTAANAPKPVKLPNSKRPKNTFTFHDYALENALRDMNVDNKGMADMQNAMNIDSGNGTGGSTGSANTDRMAREIEVGPERFQAASGGILERLGDAIHRTISAVEEVPRRSDLWNSIVVVGNGSKVKGFKEALTAHLQAKYLISPSSATMFTSEIPSNMSTPLATGMNTPQSQQAMPVSMQSHGNPSSQVNPMLLAATAGAGGQNPYSTGISPAMTAAMVPGLHASTHSQTPTNIDIAKIPEYFPEWKDVGYEEAVFLGAQVAVKVIFSGGDGGNKAYMTRSDYNDQGPQAIHDFSL